MIFTEANPNTPATPTYSTKAQALTENKRENFLQLSAVYAHSTNLHVFPLLFLIPSA